MNEQHEHSDLITTSVTVTRGCTRFTLNIKGTPKFPSAVVTAAVIPNRHLGTFRVVVTAASYKTREVATVPELGQDNIYDHDSALSWAREVIRGAEYFWKETAGLAV